MTVGDDVAETVLLPAFETAAEEDDVAETDVDGVAEFVPECADDAEEDVDVVAEIVMGADPVLLAVSEGETDAVPDFRLEDEPDALEDASILTVELVKAVADRTGESEAAEVWVPEPDAVDDTVEETVTVVFEVAV